MIEHALAVIGALAIFAFFALIVAAVFYEDCEDDGWNPFQ